MNGSFIWVVLALAAAASIIGGGLSARFINLPYWRGVVLIAAAGAAFSLVAVLMDQPNPAVAWVFFLATAGVFGRYVLGLAFGQILRIVLGTLITVLLILVCYRILFVGSFA